MENKETGKFEKKAIQKKSKNMILEVPEYFTQEELMMQFGTR